MKKLIFISLLVMPFCKAADPDQSWHDAVQGIPNLQQHEVLFLNNNQIQAIPANLNLPNLQALHLNNNQIAAIPANFNPPELRELHLSNNLIQAIPDDLELHELRRLDLSYNDIREVNPARLLEQFPRLEYINLSNNPVYQEYIQDLRDAAYAANRNIKIIADNIISKGSGIKKALPQQ